LFLISVVIAAEIEDKSAAAPTAELLDANIRPATA
jgi:hypothetical protein